MAFTERFPSFDKEALTLQILPAELKTEVRLLYVVIYLVSLNGVLHLYCSKSGPDILIINKKLYIARVSVLVEILMVSSSNSK